MTAAALVRQLRRAAKIACVVISAFWVTAPTTADARVDTGAAIGIGLGSFALGSTLGAASRPYYGPAYYPYGYYYPPPAPVYYPPPAPAYYPTARSCWDTYYGRYYAC